MAASSSALDVSYIEVICSYPTREALCAECPAMLVLLYEHVVAALQAGRRVVDPFRGTSRQDHVSELLAARSVTDLLDHVYPPSPTTTTAAATAVTAASIDSSDPGATFWRLVRAALEAAWAPPHDVKARALLAHVQGQPRFHFTNGRDGKAPGGGFPLHPVSLERALTTSKRFLRTATTCALDGSTDALGGQQAELQAVLQLARLVPHTSASAALSPAASASGGGLHGAAQKEVTPEGLNFCMVSLQQRWWLLVNAALERVLLLTRSDPTGSGSAVTKPLLWQLLAVLAVLDTSQCIFAFPERQQDLAAHHLLARLSEIGLVYPMLSDERKCFAVSPDFLHALHWHASAPLSLTFNQHLVRSTSSVSGGGGGRDGSSGGDVRREDADTIITETNFRLYAYTRDADLLNILNQFAELEEVVNESLYCYRVTRDSFAAAMRKGITATQVLRFLSLRAHPSMLQRYGERAELDDGAGAAPTAHSGAFTSTASRSSRRAAVPGAVDGVAELVVPQSFCDQMRMWESECRRVVFEHHVVLLRNVSPEQQKAVAAHLTETGEADAIVHTERGYMVLREEVFDRLIAPLLGGS